MSESLIEKLVDPCVPILPVREAEFDAWIEGRSEPLRQWARAAGFRAKPGSWCLVPGEDGHVHAVVAGVGAPVDPWSLAQLPGALPDGVYFIESDWIASDLELAAIGWALGAYQYTRYKGSDQVMARLVVDASADARRVKDIVHAVYLVRDLVNTPAGDMLPEHLGETLETLARTFDARFEQVVGDALLDEHYPAVHAVGRASAHAPRLLDLRWGEESNPRLTLVGKGVCFDSGGLDLKAASGMRLMKKDMGGAAHAIGLARLVMSTALPVRLRLLVPAVENAVSGNAYRPGDVLASRKGLSIEIDNTDAEGRVVLSDALTEAGSESPDLLIDFATLTGAARVALGTDVAALFSNDDQTANGILAAAERINDPVWRLPLHAPYRELIESRVADIANASSQPYAGAITAALFLQAFVPEDTPWVHLDVMAWNTRTRAGRPEGGDAMGLRAVFDYLCGRYTE